MSVLCLCADVSVCTTPHAISQMLMKLSYIATEHIGADYWVFDFLIFYCFPRQEKVVDTKDVVYQGENNYSSVSELGELNPLSAASGKFTLFQK